jgi:hypothetical protein
LGGFWKTSNSLFFITFLGEQKSAKVYKKSESEAKAMPRGGLVHCRGVERHPGEGLPGLKGGTSLTSARLLPFAVGRLRGPSFLFFLFFGTNFLPIRILLKIDLS